MTQLVKKTIRNQKGFTLIELMIVLVVLGILTLIAVPSYREYATRTSRTAAVSDVQELSLFLERAFSAQGRFDDVATPAQLVNPLPFTFSPQGSGIDGSGNEFGDPKYTLVSAVTATTYQLTATPFGGQLDDTDCGTLRLDQAGTLCIYPASGSAFICSDSASSTELDAVAACW